MPALKQVTWSLTDWWKHKEARLLLFFMSVGLVCIAADTDIGHLSDTALIYSHLLKRRKKKRNLQDHQPMPGDTMWPKPGVILLQ